MSNTQAFLLGEKPFDSYLMSQPDDKSYTFDIRSLIGYSVHTYWTGASTTTSSIIIQASNDQTSWVTVDTVNIDTVAGSDLLNVERAMYQWMRIYYIKGAETSGLLTVSLCGKG